MTTQQRKDEEIILSKGDKTFKFLFQLINKDQMLIKAQQQQKGEVTSHSYQKVLRISDLPERKGIIITDMNVVLDQIKFSSKNSQLDFALEDKKNVKLYFYFFGGEEKEQIDIPFGFNSHDYNSFYALSSTISENRKIVAKSFIRIKGLQIQLNKLKNNRNLFTNEVNHILNDLKNYIKSIGDQIISNKKSSDDSFNQIKTQQSSFSSKLDNSTKQFSNLNAQIKNDFITHKEQITQQHSKIISRLTPSTFKFRLR